MDKEAPCQTPGNLTDLFIKKCTEVPCLALGNLRKGGGSLGRWESDRHLYKEIQLLAGSWKAVGLYGVGLPFPWKCDKYSYRVMFTRTWTSYRIVSKSVV